MDHHFRSSHKKVVIFYVPGKKVVPFNGTLKKVVTLNVPQKKVVIRFPERAIA